MKFLFARTCRAHVCGACVLIQLLSTAFAADAEPTGELSLSLAIDTALQRNPALAVSSYELKMADARVVSAGRRPSPEISLELENFAGSGSTRGTTALESTLALSQVIELGSKREHRIEIAAMNRELSGIERSARQLDVLADVTRRFIDVVLAQHTAALTERAVTLSEHTLAAITTRVAAARSPQAEQSRASISVARARIEQQEAIGKLQAARRALAALWGSRSPSFASAAADLFTLPEAQPFDALSVRLQRNPDFLRFATEARLRVAEARLAQAQSKPDLSVSAGIRRFEATGDSAVVAGISIPLSFANRDRGAVREAELHLDQVRAQSQATFLQAETTLFGLYQEMASARIRAMTLRDEALPRAEAALTQTQYGYERGRFSYLELASAQQELLALQSASLEAAADYHRLMAEIERLTGEPLTNY